eukprot:10568673-Ditylum_brightwellii.AAC.1
MTRSSNVVANIVKQTWLTRYLWPQKVILDRDTEFMKDFITLVQDEYGIKWKPITTRNPQENSIVEKVQQTTGNPLHTFEPGSAELDPEDSWSGILSTVMFALQSTIHMTHKATPMQLIFRRDTILNAMHLANWWFIQDHQQNLIKNNKWENAKQKPHKYHFNDKVMIKNDQKLKYRIKVYSRLYQLTQVNNNRTVCIKSIKIMDTYNTQNAMLYRK